MAGESVSSALHHVELSNLDKVLFPEDRLTKGALIEYYKHIADTMLPHLQGRLISLERFPDGIYGGKFYQKQVPSYFPEWIPRIEVFLKEGGSINQTICENKDTLVYLANQVSVPHMWLSRVDRPDYPDRMIFDLDPPDGSFEPARYTALILREFLREVGLDSFVMTTGSTGLHVAVPLDRSADFETVRKFAKDMVDVLIRLEPDAITATPQKEDRGARMFIDIGRNAFGQTSVTPYAVRALPGAPVAASIDWSELREKGLNARKYTIKNILAVREGKDDPWREIFHKAYSLDKPLRRLKMI
ncbi:MAG TPA: non-homologous end-joining DNA ligase [Dissulfurispiraceae bacterium]